MTTKNNDYSKEEVKIGIQYSPTVADIGPLISTYGDEPELLASSGGYRGYEEENELEITIKRTHEWEHVVYLTIAGVGTFVGAILKTLGERTGDWIYDQFKSQNPRSVQLKVGDEDTFEISAEQAEQGQIVVDAIEEAKKKDEKLVIEFK